MAGQVYTSTESGISLSTGATKTVMLLKAPSNKTVNLHEFGVTFAGTSATADQLLVVVQRYSSDGTMSASTEVKRDTDDPDAEGVVTHTASSEPTAVSNSALFKAYIHPQQGIVYRPLTAIKLKAGERVGIAVTTGSQTATATAHVWWSE